MNNVYIRSVEPADYLALQPLYAHPKVYRDTLQLPLPTHDIWGKKIANTAAIALYKKFGFETEGTGKRFAFRDGQYVDIAYMARVIEPK
ncbi:hypothetical protein [Yersinia ruckeri]|uniref:hypothetical protein n=1 Tax=Yersinia ruckeri TaxID=29486 RepID=UPI0008FE3AAA|nr:hypothetical protein [Yersinia ruckeri]OJB92311.1 hypothetical protein AXW59_00745 [Yersinia ruckeri]OJB95469.1 hypothetical protein AXW58_00745 [Yersinia ruckeri]OJC02417.1 hypothetical protein AXW57_00745 [Yersinia ruckeri]